MAWIGEDGPYSSLNIYKTFFRSVPNSSFSLGKSEVGDCVTVQWLYMCTDFGMDCMMAKVYSVKPCEEGGFLVKEKEELEWQRADSEVMATFMIFDHYHAFAKQNEEDYLTFVTGKA